MPGRIGILLMFGALGMGCAFGARTELPRSASQQLLATQAVVRALDQFDFPDLHGKKVMVHVGAPGDAVDAEFLRTAVQIELFEEAARVVATPEDADLVLGVLVGSMGLDIRGRFFGIEGTEGGWVPFTIPELALYKRTRTRGFARAEFALVDPRSGELIERSHAVEGNTQGVSTTLLLVFSWDSSDIPPVRAPDASDVKP
ncbi:MAG TPA: hypothetical protein VFY49_13305 [Myxococcota bacterium]|nr:hypothetical protein [Myxococcota bacterium]